MTFDATIHAEYSDINTVRQSQEKRGERSLVLVEGSFDTTDELMLHEVDDAPETPGTLVEAWGLELPADTGHTLRYMPPETTDNAVLWVRTDAGWQQADTSVDGSYLTCTAPARYNGLRRCADARQQGAPARGGLRRRSRTAGDFVHRPQAQKAKSKKSR